MEDGLIIGIDLGDIITQVRCSELEKDWNISTVLCKKKQENVWYIGKEAYNCNLQGEGILSDKLISLFKKEKTATFEDVKYTGEDLLRQFLSEIFSMLKRETGKETIGRVVLCIDYIEAGFIRKLISCVASIGVPEERIHIISREEAFAYYILSQRKEIWNHEVGVFELTKAGLTYFHLRVKRNLKDLTVFAESVLMEESFSLDVLSSASGRKLGDQILSSCAERMLHGKLFSAIILTGNGFERTDWAPAFMQVIAEKRRVYLDNNLFAQGCLSKAGELVKGRKEEAFTCVCKGRLESTISMDVMFAGKEKRLVMIPAGAVWYEAKAEAEFILDGDKEIAFLMTSVYTGQQEKKAFVPLEGFPERPPKTTRVEVCLRFLDAKTMEVTVRDLGFGELFPATNAVVRREVML